ncbi:hypothetical protein [Flavobacterium sp. 3HN19-14]|uniref:hypothetical protein n=1 Tax=Flavobacterium sp. 3HN19-14 TaxID=3448133 RepID=UPI003EDF4652
MKANSLSLMVLGALLLVGGIYLPINIYVRYALLLASIIINVVAVVRSFQEKRNKN